MAGGYVSGALLTPVSSLKQLVHAKLTKWSMFGSVATGSAESVELIGLAGERFDVSREAAQARVSQLGFLTDGEGNASLQLPLG